MRPIITRKSGRVEGIAHCYRRSENLFYVRFCYHGIDRTKAFTIENATFSGLERTSERAFNALKREVMSEVGTTTETPKTPKTVIETARDELQKFISKAFFGKTDKTVKRRLRDCENLGITTNQKIALEIDEHNRAEVKKIFDDIYALDLPDRQKETRALSKYNSLSAVFKKVAIYADRRYQTTNPLFGIQRPSDCKSRREDYPTPEEASGFFKTMPKKTLLDRESRIFALILITTGQRPIDAYRFKLSDIEDGHYRFYNNKTKSFHRVAHLIDPYLISEAKKLCLKRGTTTVIHKTNNEYSRNSEFDSIFTHSEKTILADLNGKIHEFFKGRQISCYNFRHLFVTEITKIAISKNRPDLGSIFTHDDNAAIAHYIHDEQAIADDILTDYLASFENLIGAFESF